MIDFLLGAVAFGHVVAAAFFLRFWRRTSDRLFAWFALAFVLLAVYHVISFAYSAVSESTGFYALRVLGYFIILCAIIDKNLRRDGADPRR